MWRLFSLLLLVAGALAAFANSSGQFRFAIIGDRTGGAVPGVYEETWREVYSKHPDFAVNVGDTIQGGNDANADAEWAKVTKLILPYRRCPLFLVPGNHDVWSAASAAVFQKYARHSLHYGFDYGNAHFTVLDNSRSDSLAPDEIQFLRQDLQAHEKQPVKFVFSHRPSWILQLVLANPNFPVHKIAQQYNVKYVIAGHIHQMLRFHLDGITYVSMASSGGHLRAEKDYKDGWFFGYALISVRGDSVNFTVKELGPPFGRSRQTDLERWGPAGLTTNEQ